MGARYGPGRHLLWPMYSNVHQGAHRGHRRWGRWGGGFELGKSMGTLGNGFAGERRASVLFHSFGLYELVLPQLKNKAIILLTPFRSQLKLSSSINKVRYG